MNNVVEVQHMILVYIYALTFSQTLFNPIPNVSITSVFYLWYQKSEVSPRSWREKNPVTALWLLLAGQLGFGFVHTSCHCDSYVISIWDVILMSRTVTELSTFIMCHTGEICPSHRRTGSRKDRHCVRHTAICLSSSVSATMTAIRWRQFSFEDFPAAVSSSSSALLHSAMMMVVVV